MAMCIGKARGCWSATGRRTCRNRGVRPPACAAQYRRRRRLSSDDRAAISRALHIAIIKLGEKLPWSRCSRPAASISAVRHSYSFNGTGARNWNSKKDHVMPAITTKDGIEISTRIGARAAHRLQPWLAAVGR